MEVVPAASAFSLAAARLGWPLQEVETLSLHGRPVELIRPLLHPGTRILALTSDGGGAGADRGAARRRRLRARRGCTVLEALGGPDERRVRARPRPASATRLRGR